MASDKRTVDPKLWPTKTKEGERDWYVEARGAFENCHFIRDWHTDEGRQYVNAKAEDVIAQLLEERDAAIARGDLALVKRDAERERAEKAEQERDEARQERDSGVRLDALGDAGSRRRAERAEVLLRKSAAWIGDGPSGDRLLSEIREALKDA